MAGLLESLKQDITDEIVISDRTENLMKYETDQEVIFIFLKLISENQMLCYVLDPETKEFEKKKVWIKSKIKRLISEEKILPEHCYYIKCLGKEKMKGKFKNEFYNFEVKECIINRKNFSFIE